MSLLSLRFAGSWDAQSPRQPVAKILEILLPYFGLTDLLTDDLELSVIPSPPLIKFAIAIHKDHAHKLGRTTLNGGEGGVSIIFHRRVTRAAIWSKKAAGISSECLNLFFLIMSSSLNHSIKNDAYWKGYICTKTFKETQTDSSPQRPLQSVYCEFRLPAPKTIPMLKLYSFSREKNGENLPLLLWIREYMNNTSVCRIDAKI